MKHVVFGEIIHNLDVINEIERYGNDIFGNLSRAISYTCIITL